MRVSGIFSKAVVQAVLVLGSDTWVTNPRMGQTLGGLQHRVDHRITERHLWQIPDGSWGYPPLEEAMREAGLEEVEV